MPVRAILFDAFGTVWFEPPWHQAWFQVLSAAGTGLDLATVKSAIQEGLPEFSSRFQSLERGGRPVSDRDLAELFRSSDSAILDRLGLGHLSGELVPKLTARLVDGPALYPETVEALDSLYRDGYRMAMVSNGAYQQEIAQRLGIAKYFRAVLGSAHIGYAKPHPKMFQMALHALDVNAADAIEVGDDLGLDVLGAKSAGVRAVWLNRHGAEHDGRHPKPDAQIATLRDLPGLIARWT